MALILVLQCWVTTLITAEFLAATIETHGAISEDSIAEAFDLMDTDDSGYISTKNLRDMLGDQMPAEFIQNIILEAESKLCYSQTAKQNMASKAPKDHFISYEEFLGLWEQQQDQSRQEAWHKIQQARSSLSSTSLHSITEIAPSITIHHNYSGEKGEGDSIDKTSDVSIDLRDPSCSFSRSNFLSENVLSVRRYADI